MLKASNQFSRQVDQMAVSNGVHVIFSETVHSDNLSRYFTEAGTTSMFETKDHSAVDMVATFIGTLVDRCCAFNSSTVTICFKRYVEIYDLPFPRYGSPGVD